MDHLHSNTARNLDQAMHKAAQLGQFDKFCALFETIHPPKMGQFAKDSRHFLQGALAFFAFEPTIDHKRLLNHMLTFMQHTPASEKVDVFCRTLVFLPNSNLVSALYPVLEVVLQRGLVEHNSFLKPELDRVFAQVQHDTLLKAIGQHDGVSAKRRL